MTCNSSDNNTKENLDSLLEKKLIAFDHAYDLYEQVIDQPFDVGKFSVTVQLVYYSIMNAKEVALEIHALGYGNRVLDNRIRYIENALNGIRYKVKRLAKKYRYMDYSKDQVTILFLEDLLSPSLYHKTKNEIIN